MKLVKRFTKFLQDVRHELKQVTWPTRPELIGSVLVVFVGVVILAGYIGVVDFMGIFDELIEIVGPECHVIW